MQKEVSAKVPEKKDDEGNVTQQALEAVVFVDYADEINEAVERYGEEAILSNAFANWKVVLQAGIRNGLKAGLTQEQLQEKLGSSIMGVAATGGRVDAQTAFIAKFKMATPEGQAEMLDMLRAAAEA